MQNKTEDYRVTQNACKLCNPLGACIAVKGIANSMALLHGSQGCSTYIRRYTISHFKEPIDIASSNFSEDTAIFGGKSKLIQSLENIIVQYNPELIGIATTCLSETIGDDVSMIIREYRDSDKGRELPAIIDISTPSYKGTHVDGFHAAVRSAIKNLAKRETFESSIALFPGMLSPADLRYLKEIMRDYGTDFIMLPDYSDTLDGVLWDSYKRIPLGGTSVEQIISTGNAEASVEFGSVISDVETPGTILETKCGVERNLISMPIGVKNTDRFFNKLSEITGKDMPVKYRDERGRLIDSYADAHKHLFGVRALVYGEEDLVVSIASFLNEIGIKLVIAATGAKGAAFGKAILGNLTDVMGNEVNILSGADFNDIQEAAVKVMPDIMIGNSKGYNTSRKLGIPLVRVGFPVHDRAGGQRILHVGYRGTQQLFDTITNTIIARKQDLSPVGYSYM